MFSIKFILDKEIRRIDTGDKENISYAELKSTCERLFQGKLTLYTLKYHDGEDWITCSSDEELHHAFQLAQMEKRILKFRVIPANKNILDSLEEALKTLLAKNPAKSLWELIKKEEQQRKLRKAKALAAKAISMQAIKQESEPEIPSKLESTTQSEETSGNMLETEVKTEETQTNDELPAEIPSEKFPEQVQIILEPEHELEDSQISQTDSISIMPQEDVPVLEEEETQPVQQEEEEGEAFSQTRSVPDLSLSQLDPEKLALKLIQLEEMGFSNREKNATCLIKFNGDMMEAVKSLLEDV